MSETKKCPRCGKTKPCGEFYTSKQSRDGRELLGSCCNTAVGLFHEDPDILLKASEYLRRHNAAQ